jgi:hypothetical protein
MTYKNYKTTRHTKELFVLKTLKLFELQTTSKTEGVSLTQRNIVVMEISYSFV